MNCKCGCGREVAQSEKGRPGEYYSGACRVRSHRQRERTYVPETASKIDANYKYTVYGLLDPIDNQFHYIGMSGDVLERYKAHLSCKGDNEEKKSWIRGLRQKNLRPHLVFLETTGDMYQGLKRESYWIRYYIEAQHPLTNVAENTPRSIEIMRLSEPENTAIQQIKPILKYPGSKARLAEWIISFFPTHVHYVEPYCGSAAVFFLKKPSEHEVLNDLNRSIVNLFRVIRSRGGELAQATEMTPWSEEEYALVERNCTDGDEVEQARRFLIRCWQAHGGTLHQVSGWKHNGLNGHAYPVRLWRQLPSRLLAVVDRLKDAEIRNRPALEIIDYYNAPDCLLYVDPPYMLSTRGRKYYPYEMEDSEHMTLLDALDAHKGAVVLSGYAHPLYDERLSHWQRVTLSAVAEHGKQRTEVLWLNRCASQSQQGRLFE